MSGAADPQYQTPFGSFALSRYPRRPQETLHAWCAADTLLLEEAHRRAVSPQHTLVVNDVHGALCVALLPQALWTDSATATLALRHNEQHNQRPPTALIPSTQNPAGDTQLVVLRVPKTLPYFEYQLYHLARCLRPGATVLAAGMDKHLSPRTADLLEQYIGPTQRHRGQRKARLFSAVLNQRAPAKTDLNGHYYCDALEAELQALPNVFSRDKLDHGSRLLLASLGQFEPVATVLDLACGNGVLGLNAAKTGLAQKVVFCDESAMAIASAQDNARRLFPEQYPSFDFHQGDGLTDYPGEPVDLILCNPPFHLDHTVDEFAGRRLLQQCAPHLAPQGRLCLVANRHLQYLPMLRRTFQRVEKLDSNSKFNVYLAHRS